MRWLFTTLSDFDTTLNKTIKLVQDQGIINVNMIMRRTPAYFPGSISGRVTKDSTSGRKGVTVIVDSAGLSTVTDSLGNFTITGIIAGTH